MPIVEAVGASSSSLDPARKGLAKRIEKAMSDAVLEASALGINNPDEVRKMMLQARHRVKIEMGMIPVPTPEPVAKKPWWKVW